MINNFDFIKSIFLALRSNISLLRNVLTSKWECTLHIAQLVWSILYELQLPFVFAFNPSKKFKIVASNNIHTLKAHIDKSQLYTEQEMWLLELVLNLFLVLISFFSYASISRCGCDECVISRLDDSLRHSRSRINAYRALASPSLIALSSKDPILTAFELSWELRRLSFLEHEFKVITTILFISTIFSLKFIDFQNIQNDAKKKKVSRKIRIQRRQEIKIEHFYVNFIEWISRIEKTMPGFCYRIIRSYTNIEWTWSYAKSRSNQFIWTNVWTWRTNAFESLETGNQTSTEKGLFYFVKGSTWRHFIYRVVAYIYFYLSTFCALQSTWFNQFHEVIRYSIDFKYSQIYLRNAKSFDLLSYLLFTQFVAHPNVQQLLASIWYEGKRTVYWQHSQPPNIFYRYVYITTFFLFLFFWWFHSTFLH